MLTIILRTILIYITVTAAVRIMGKRQVSDLQTSELVITFIISQVATLPLESPERPLLISLVPIMIIIAIELIVSMLMMKSRCFRSLICGHPIIVIKDGKIIPSQLRKLRISYEDLYSLLREQELSDESKVRYGIIEPNGTLSVLTDENISKNTISSEDLRDELTSLPPDKPQSNSDIISNSQVQTSTEDSQNNANTPTPNSPESNLNNTNPPADGQQTTNHQTSTFRKESPQRDNFLTATPPKSISANSTPQSDSSPKDNSSKITSQKESTQNSNPKKSKRKHNERGKK